MLFGEVVADADTALSLNVVRVGDDCEGILERDYCHWWDVLRLDVSGCSCLAQRGCGDG